VPPLHARERLRWLLLGLGAVVGCGILVGAFLLGVMLQR
jgi:hypothetical protein